MALFRAGRLQNVYFYPKWDSTTVIDFLDDVKTKFGTGRFLVKIKFNKEDPDKDARKFFTNSQEIKYILGKIKERNAFPRKVTMRASGTRYYFE
jgi:hypothetical protein